MVSKYRLDLKQYKRSCDYFITVNSSHLIAKAYAFNGIFMIQIQSDKSTVYI